MWGKRPLFQTTAISSLQLWTEKIKMYFCPNHAASSCHTAVLLRKCGRETTIHPLSRFYTTSPRMTNHVATVTSSSLGPRLKSHWRYKDVPHWPFLLHMRAEQFTLQTMHNFSWLQWGFYTTWLQSLLLCSWGPCAKTGSFPRWLCTLCWKTGSAGARSWDQLTC